GGTFPIEVTPPFFQSIHPYLPFTYGIGLFREAIGGIYTPNLVRDVSVLAGFLFVSIVIGLVLKRYFNRASQAFQRKLEKEDLIE
ncbi:MAG: YhgE/Pip domain-containing protein, partial [Bacilli bacterium]